MKTFEEFKKALLEGDLRQELFDRLAERKPETKEMCILATVEFAVEKGYAVTAEDLSIEAAEMRELTDEETENAAGGIWCWNDYSCIAAWYHDCCNHVMDECPQTYTLEPSSCRLLSL